MATYAVGDLQGCLQPLLCLLREVSFDPDKDRLWLTGDLINRGPESLQTLRFVRDLGSAAVTVLGNHDLHLLAVARGHRPPSRSDTLEVILNAKDRDDLLEWLRQQPLLHHDKTLGYTLVHAGIPPIWSLKKAIKRADEVAEILRSDQLDNFLGNMYGNSPNKWKSSLKGPERWRVITNYFTRMRFCTSEGELELLTKAGPKQAPRGYAPWFAHKKRLTRDERIVFGHWASLEGHSDTPNIFALDSGCVWGRHMTLMRLEDQQYFTCNCKP